MKTVAGIRDLGGPGIIDARYSSTGRANSS